MRRGVSTHMFIRQRLGTAILDRVSRAGFRLVEIFCARQHMDYRSRNQTLDLAAWFSSNELKLHSMHMPMYRDEEWGKSGPQAKISIAEIEKGRRVDAVDEIKRALEIAESMPFDYAILHLGSSGEDFDQRKMDAAMSSIEHLRLFGRQRGVSLLLENTPNELSAPARLVHLMNQLRFPDLGFCFDSGHARMAGDPLETWEKMEPYVRSTHLHDNNGLKDDHLLPGEGSIDWTALGGAMRKASHDFPWMLEIHDPCSVEDPVTHSWDLFQRWEETIPTIPTIPS